MPFLGSDRHGKLAFRCRGGRKKCRRPRRQCLSCLGNPPPLGFADRREAFSKYGCPIIFRHMKIARNVGAVVVAFVVGSATMFILHDLHMMVWPEAPMPKIGADPEDFREWTNGLKLSTKLIATVVHWLGTAAGVAVGMLLAAPSVEDGKRPIWPAWAMGGWFFLGGILNAAQMGTALWLSALDALGYLPTAYLVARMLRR